eukprot:3316190-Prymnesium_polylepis.1
MIRYWELHPVTPGFRHLKTAATEQRPARESNSRVPLGASGSSDATPEGERYGEQDQQASNKGVAKSK